LYTPCVLNSAVHFSNDITLIKIKNDFFLQDTFCVATSDCSFLNFHAFLDKKAHRLLYLPSKAHDYSR